MSTRIKEAKLNRCALFRVVLLLVSFVILPGVSAADEKITGRIVSHYIKIETMEVGDIPGHVLGVAQKIGLLFFSTGEVATYKATFYADLNKGNGPFVDYSLITDQAGDTRFIKATGTADTVSDGKKFVFEGTMECIGGTGKYEGYKGTGSFKGERVGELKTGGDAYFDFSMNCGKQ